MDERNFDKVVDRVCKSLQDYPLQQLSNLLWAGCGFVSQNIYLYCASEGLGSVVRGMFGKDKLHTLLGLDPTQEFLLTQSVGYSR